MSFYTTQNLYSTRNSLGADYLFRFTYPWEALAGLGEAILAIGGSLSLEEFDNPAPDIWIHETAKVAPTASLTGPCIIDAGAEVRHCAFIRGNALVGKNAVVGNSTELKNVLLFDGVQVPHFNYVGDSILGFKSHLGAGAITSNVKSDKSPVVIKTPEGLLLNTGRKKVGALLGDEVEVGCNSVLNPGTVLGSGCMVYPTSCVRGAIPPQHIVKGVAGIFPKNSGNV